MPDDRMSLRQLLTRTFAALLSPAIQVLPGLTARQVGPLNFEGLRRLGVVLKRAQYFLTCSGRAPRGLRISEDGLLRHLVSLEAPALAPPMPEQLSLFDP